LVGDGTYLTVGEAVTRLTSEPHPVPVAEQTLRRMVDRGEVTTVRIGLRRDRRLLATAVDALKERMWAEAHPPANDSGPALEEQGQADEQVGE
jgi:hypothetical protein